MKNFFVILVFFCFFALAIFIWQAIYLPKEPESRETETFLIKKGEGAKEISVNLEKQGLIKSGPAFRIYALFKGATGRLRAGKYTLNPSMTVREIVKKFVSGETAKMKLTFPEGSTLNQINQILQNSNVTTPGLVTFRVGDFKKEFGFLSGVSDEASLEGFLFPDTYFFEAETEEREVLKVFLKNFEKKLNSKISLENIGKPDIILQEEMEKQKKSVFEIVKMASLLEKEVKTLEDKKWVSGILWKRLENRIPLQVDATITYITGKKTVEISKEETLIDSPYNTYKYLGLPKGPICNPGFESILAAMFPEDSPFWYYLSTPEGKTIFSENLEQHNIAKAKYLR